MMMSEDYKGYFEGLPQPTVHQQSTVLCSCVNVMAQGCTYSGEGMLT